MGLGGFLAAKSELDHYISEKKREEREVIECPEEEEEECFEVLAEYGITREVPPPATHPSLSHPSPYIYFPPLPTPSHPIPSRHAAPRTFVSQN